MNLESKKNKIKPNGQSALFGSVHTSKESTRGEGGYRRIGSELGLEAAAICSPLSLKVLDFLFILLSLLVLHPSAVLSSFDDGK